MALHHKAADWVTALASTWTFVIASVFGIMFWMWVQEWVQFDPFPFILLNLCLSCVAALQAPIILMSSRRQSEKDSERLEQDLKVDLAAKEQLDRVEEKLDKLLKKKLK